MAQSFRILPEQSEIRILLYRAGLLSNFGHNHVIVSQNIEGGGTINFEALQNSSFLLKFPVEALIVDQQEHRQQEGEGFESVATESDIADIREEMLGEDILNAKQFSHVLVQSKKVTGKLPDPRVLVTIKIREATQEMEIPITLQKNGKQVIANGTIELKQTDFGIEPISLFLGSIQVKDTFRIKFQIISELQE